VVLLVGCPVQQRPLLADTGGSVEEEGQLDAMGLGGGHGAVVSLAVELLDLILLCQGAANPEGAVEGGLVAAIASLSTVH